VVICLEHSADLHMAQWMPLLLTVSCFSKIQIGFTFLVPAHPGSPGQRAVKHVSVCVIAYFYASATDPVGCSGRSVHPSVHACLGMLVTPKHWPSLTGLP